MNRSKKEKDNKYHYRPSKFLLWLALGLVVLMLFIGKSEDHLTKEALMVAGPLLLIALIALYIPLANMYVTIVDNVHLIVSWHDTFRKVSVRIPEIKYILRIPRSLIPGFGIRMMIYVVEDGMLKHIVVNEFGLNDWDLREFLDKIRSVNPNIVLDREYEEFLKQPRDPERSNSFSGNKTKNTVASVEQFLRDRGKKLH